MLSAASALSGLKSPISTRCCGSQLRTERGKSFDVGNTFFRSESSTGRDLGVLSAAIYKKSNDALRVLDAMCGCGIRSLRYLEEAEADFFVSNDANREYRAVISSNLERADGDGRRWTIKHLDANRLLMECYLERSYFDVIDVDSFGSESSYLRLAMCAVKLNGQLYVTSTDGFSSAGHQPHHTLAAYGSYIQHMPYCNEVGLRMLIGGAVREASVFGYHVVPLFSYYSYHGPVFRVMLQVRRGKSSTSHYGFISYCSRCGNSRNFSWDQLGQMGCSCNDGRHSVVVSGPLWTGPLHSEPHLTEMLALSRDWGWTGNGSGRHLETLLKLMIGECNPLLPCGYIKLDEISHRAKVNWPSIGSFLQALHREGYCACRSHIASNAIKTNSSMLSCVNLAKKLQLVRVLPSLVVTWKERAWPSRKPLLCQFWPQFRDMGCHPDDLDPLIATEWTSPAPPTLWTRTRLK
ncbi:hypothetical protein M569_12971 [Genlisea aurea]|uniref:tRNA (guanine(26)-N(2))-dimethyltransferase n=1 Tax=Genlisea aurea TaxID=192259 RepID=S8C4K6_9LAMI|nr:hypothetical protein M569_12971 [Genlisea aurea]